jgi:hypothetical protein
MQLKSCILGKSLGRGSETKFKGKSRDATVFRAYYCIEDDLFSPRDGTVQYSTVQYSTVQYSTVQYSTVQYSTGLSSSRGARKSSGELFFSLEG